MWNRQGPAASDEQKEAFRIAHGKRANFTIVNNTRYQSLHE
ncbi:hypothetical protein [Bacillus smithii]